MIYVVKYEYIFVEALFSKEVEGYLSKQISQIF